MPLPISSEPFGAAAPLTPVPPLAGFRVPVIVTAPVPAPNDMPVVPPEIDETETPESACQTAAEPFDVRT